MIPEERLQAVIDRRQHILDRLAAAPDRDEYVRLSRELSEIGELADKAEEVARARRQLHDTEGLIGADGLDAEMAALAEEERRALVDEITRLSGELRVLMLPKDAVDERSVVLEVRAGTGGDEAALFAGDLFRMYERYADLKGWKVDVLSIAEGEVGGFREVVAGISGRGAYARLKFESGVHRVQRVPETESSGRIHTSAATVAVLPEAEEVDVEIRPEDIRIDTMRASGAGGQHVNTTDSAVRITHLPTGMIVTSSEKSQHQNRANAMKTLRARLFEIERERQASARAEARKEQVGSGDRSERIRTYNFPQGRVTDHRIGLTLYKLDRVLAGEAVDELVEALSADEMARRLADFDRASD